MKRHLTLIIVYLCAVCQAQERMERTAVRLGFVFGDDRPFKECHASTLVALDDGGFLVAWFGGTKEKNPDVAIWTAKCRVGVWSAPRNTMKIRQEAHWNPVLFRDETGTVYRQQIAFGEVGG